MPRGRKSQTGVVTWGGRWLAALAARGPDVARTLARGRAASRGGRLTELVVQPGGAIARVVEPRGSVREVKLEVDEIASADRAAVLDGLLSSAAHAADLLAGSVPPTLPQTVAERLFPATHERVAFRCSCGDGRPMCRHGAAVAHAIAVGFDQDALRLLEMRGIPRADVVAKLSGSAEGAPTEVAPRAVAEMNWEQFVGAGIVAPELHFHLEPPDVDALVLRQLGVPKGATGPAEWEAALASVYRRVTATALRMGLDQDEPQG
jgi:uncharacterized Zn finger protein